VAQQETQQVETAVRQPRKALTQQAQITVQAVAVGQQHKAAQVPTEWCM
jgi:hypothetical protein